MKSIHRIRAVVPSLLLFTIICNADHLPPELQARGRPEKELARIHLEHTKLVDVIRMVRKWKLCAEIPLDGLKNLANAVAISIIISPVMGLEPKNPPNPLRIKATV